MVIDLDADIHVALHLLEALGISTTLSLARFQDFPGQRSPLKLTQLAPLDKIVILVVMSVNRLYALLMVPAIAFTRLLAELAKHLRREADERIWLSSPPCLSREPDTFLFDGERRLVYRGTRRPIRRR